VTERGQVGRDAPPERAGTSGENNLPVQCRPPSRGDQTDRIALSGGTPRFRRVNSIVVARRPGVVALPVLRLQ
jgi:hypothetical protein